MQVDFKKLDEDQVQIMQETPMFLYLGSTDLIYKNRNMRSESSYKVIEEMIYTEKCYHCRANLQFHVKDNMVHSLNKVEMEEL